MYAVIESGGKQYRVSEGDTVRLEKLGVEPDSTFEFDKILMVGSGENVQIGTPYVKDGKVEGTVLGDGRGKKIKVLKFKRRKNYVRKMGHRQDYTEIKIEKISAKGLAVATEESKG